MSTETGASAMLDIADTISAATNMVAAAERATSGLGGERSNALAEVLNKVIARLKTAYSDIPELEDAA